MSSSPICRRWLTIAAGARSKVKGQIPHLVTGLGITTCGYCGTALVGQTTANRNRLLHTDKSGRLISAEDYDRANL